MTCANCGGPVGEMGRMAHTDAAQTWLCRDCGGIAEALGIGARSPAFLYDNGQQRATSWTGVELGTIVHKFTPGRGRFAPIRYRVKMLDGSLWYGTGPTENGTYMRLRPMKGE